MMTLEDTRIRSDYSDEDGWDLEQAERRPGVKERSVVVSVRLAKDDFDKIAERAEAAGVPTSTFIRGAVLENVNGRSEAASAYWNGGAAAHFVTTAAFGHTTSADLHAEYRITEALNLIQYVGQAAFDAAHVPASGFLPMPE